MEVVAALAEQAWHHPDIDIRWTKATLTLTTQSVDRWIRRGMHYLTNLNEVYAGPTLKARSRATLILPPTREDVRAFATA